MRINDKMSYDKFDDGDLIIYDKEKEMTHILNSTAAEIIKLFDEDEDIDNVFSLYCNLFNIKEQDDCYIECKDDYYNVIKNLIEKQILII
ncbi:MAG: hypothetical protein ACLSVG_09170 [Clostridia bacterium]